MLSMPVFKIFTTTYFIIHFSYFLQHIQGRSCARTKWLCVCVCGGGGVSLWFKVAGNKIKYKLQ